MKKGDWYKHLFGRIDDAIAAEYFFEASFISYGIVEDRLDSMLRQLNLVPLDGVAKKIKAIRKIRSAKLEGAFRLSNWDGGKYKNLGVFGEVLSWGYLYRNPLQHMLGDPKNYHAQFGTFHTQNTKDLAIEGRRVARDLSSAVMRYKKI